MSAAASAQPELSRHHGEVPLPPWLDALRGSLRYGRTWIGIACTAAVVLLALAGPLLAPHTGSALVGAPFTGPSHAAPLGTDYLGEDVLSRLLLGGRSVLWMTFMAATIGVAFGVAIGMVAGYSRSWHDDVIMRALDVLLAFPQLVLAILFVSMLGPHPWLITVLVGISWWPSVARVARGMTLEVVKNEYIEASQLLGVPRRQIFTRDVLPMLMTTVMVEFGLRLTWSIAVISAISFLGFGIQAPAADWGLMVNENRVALAQQVWATLAPIVCIAVFAIGTNLITEGIGRAVAGIDRQRGGHGTP